MVKLAIRDDDTNFFTKVEDIEFVYKDFDDFPISFAVVPYVTDVIGGCPETKGNTTPRFFGDNENLTNWFRNQAAIGKIDILLHGLTHSYHFENDDKIPEMVWKEADPFVRKSILSAQKELSELFDYPITCFVAPSNKITKRCLQAVEDNNMNFSGIIPMKFNERFTIRNICQYVKRWTFRAVYGLPYPGMIKYSGHREINACTLVSYDYLVRMFNFCDKHDLPMAINVHYWSLRDNAEQLEMLRSFVMDYAIPRGALPSKLTDLF